MTKLYIGAVFRMKTKAAGVVNGNLTSVGMSFTGEDKSLVALAADHECERMQRSQPDVGYAVLVGELTQQVVQPLRQIVLQNLGA